MFKNLFFLFIFYSFIGWCIEIVYSLVTEKKFVNRGFLIGPYCPIYGFGCVLITLSLKDSVNDVATLFLKSILICSVLEYFTSYLMEKIFKYRWWDYSNKKFNINGRICLETTIPFGLGACIIMYFINPTAFRIIDNMNSTLSTVLCIFLLTCIVADTIFSTIIVKKIKGVQKNIIIDSTEVLKNKLIKSSKIFYKRVIASFPNFKISENKKR